MYNCAVSLYNRQNYISNVATTVPKHLNTATRNYYISVSKTTLKDKLSSLISYYYFDKSVSFFG